MLRPTDQNPNTFLDASFAEYSKLIETFSLFYRNIIKDLLNIDEYFKDGKLSDDTSVETLGVGTYSKAMTAFVIWF